LEDSEQHVICVVEVKKLAIIGAITLLEAQPVMVVGDVGFMATASGMCVLKTSLGHLSGDWIYYIGDGKILSFNLC
jgi:hypothetical protein